MEQNSSTQTLQTQSWPFPGCDTPQLGEMHLRVFPDGWDRGRTAEVATLATRLVKAGWSVGVALCSTPTYDFMQTASITWGHGLLELIQARDMVDLVKLVYKINAKQRGPHVVIVDDWMRPDTSMERGHDDTVMVEFAGAVRNGDFDELRRLSGLDYTTYTGQNNPGAKMALVAGTRFRSKGTALSDVMGGLITLDAADSVISYSNGEYSARASVNCEVRCLKLRDGQLIEPTQITRTADGMWRKGSWRIGFS
jgi:hypothetical protein